MVMNKKPFEGPKLLVCHEKHGEGYFHIPDEETLHKVALSILTGRYKQGYWYGLPSVPNPPTYDTKEKVDELKGEIHGQALKLLVRYKGELAYYQQQKEQHEDILRAVTFALGELAWEILRERSDNEYERVVLERYHTEYHGG